MQYYREISNTPTSDFKSVHDWYSHIQKEDYGDPVAIAFLSGLALNSGMQLANRNDATEQDRIKAYELVCFGLGMSNYLNVKMDGASVATIRTEVGKNLLDFVYP